MRFNKGDTVYAARVKRDKKVEIEECKIKGYFKDKYVLDQCCQVLRFATRVDESDIGATKIEALNKLLDKLEIERAMLNDKQIKNEADIFLAANALAEAEDATE